MNKLYLYVVIETMKTFIAFLLFMSFAMMETQIIWQDVFGVDVVCCADMEENEDEQEDNENEEKKKLENDKFFSAFNNLAEFGSPLPQKNRTSVQHSLISQFRSINTPPPELK